MKGGSTSWELDLLRMDQDLDKLQLNVQELHKRKAFRQNSLLRKRYKKQCTITDFNEFLETEMQQHHQAAKQVGETNTANRLNVIQEMNESQHLKGGSSNTVNNVNSD